MFRLTIRTRPEHAPGILAGMVQCNLLQIHDYGLAGKTPVLDGLHLGAALRSRGVVPGSTEWQRVVDTARNLGEPIPLYYEQLDPDEDWRPLETLLQVGHGDCEELAPGVAAELLAAGIEAVPLAYPVTPSLHHVIVEYMQPLFLWRRLRRIDPSRLGGMTTAA